MDADNWEIAYDSGYLETHNARSDAMTRVFMSQKGQEDIYEVSLWRRVSQDGELKLTKMETYHYTDFGEAKDQYDGLLKRYIRGPYWAKTKVDRRG